MSMVVSSVMTSPRVPAELSASMIGAVFNWAATLRSHQFVSLSGLDQQEYIPGNALFLIKGDSGVEVTAVGELRGYAACWRNT